MTDDSKELLPCPFCGQPPSVDTWKDYDTTSKAVSPALIDNHLIYCETCSDCSKDSIVGWNTRTPASSAETGERINKAKMFLTAMADGDGAQEESAKKGFRNIC